MPQKTEQVAHANDV